MEFYAVQEARLPIALETSQRLNPKNKMPLIISYSQFLFAK